MIRNTPEVVLLTTHDSPIHSAAETILKENFTVRCVPTPGWSFDEDVLKNVAGANAILVRIGVVTEEVMEAASDLRVVAVHGIGVDRVDLKAAEKRGIVVTNTPLANTTAVAEHTVGLILSSVRKIPASDRLMRQGRWKEAQFVFKELMNMTVGIIGFGNIGAKVAKRLGSFEAKIISYDPYVPLERFEEFGVKRTDFKTLLSESDIITVHVPLTRFTRHMISEKELKLMKRKAFIVNTSRGAVIDERALCAALCNKQIAGASLDVYEEEPLAQSSPLLEMENVVLTPHVAGTTEESLKRTAETAARDIAKVLAGEKPIHEYRKELLPYPV